MGGHLEAGFNQPLRNRTPDVTDSDKSELVFVDVIGFMPNYPFAKS
jgi:hypothetical protein